MINDTPLDLIIIGGGAAGMMAAISCRKSHPGYSIAILDRTFAPGRKILVCGGGRCNLTNKDLDKNLRSHYHGGSQTFIQSVFDQFKYNDIISFFQDLGITLVEEKKNRSGKIFPLTNQAITVTTLLADELSRCSVDLILNTECLKLLKKNGLFSISAASSGKNSPVSKKTLRARNVILSAGGKTYPALGSNGSGYELARSFGHRIVDPLPSAIPLESKNLLSQKLQGLKVVAEVTSHVKGKEQKRVVDDLLFTKYGVSGSAILSLSREFSLHLQRGRKSDCFINVNFIPGKNTKEVRRILKDRWLLRPTQSVEKSLFGLVPNKVSSALLALIKLNTEKPVHLLDNSEVDKITCALSQTKIEISGTRGWNEAEFTAGGIDTEEVTPGTLESKKEKRLYFCGEILDVDGEIGGYNLSWCWSSGWAAGKLSTSRSKERGNK